MKRFRDIPSFIAYLNTVRAELPHAQRHGLELAAKELETATKDLFGSYQDAAGPFVTWAPLAESTQQERERLGFSPDEPLLRTGSLRDSVTHIVQDDAAAVGSNDPRAVWQELGTFQNGGPHIPPRSTFGIAGVHCAENVAKIIGKTIAYAIAGKQLPTR